MTTYFNPDRGRGYCWLTGHKFNTITPSDPKLTAKVGRVGWTVETH